jgi:hypothetical protein
MFARWSCLLFLAIALPAISCAGTPYCDDGCDPAYCDSWTGDGSCCDGGCCDWLKYSCRRPIWIEADYLGWFIKGNHVPPLVTTSPDGTQQSDAGVLGQDTTVLYGGEKIDEDYRSGLRIHGGMWLDDCENCGIELGYLTLFDDSNTFTAATATPFGNGDGLPILARPFFNVESGAEDAQLVSYPDEVDGAIAVRSSSQLDAAEVLFRSCRYRDCRGRCDLLLGYRFLRFDERLTIEEDLVVTGTGGLIANGTQIQVFDAFATDNTFHGGQLGLSTEFWREYVTVQLRAKVALGGITRKTTIAGGTQNTVPGGGTSSASGGLLALPTNIGTYRDSDFAALPEFGAKLKLQLTQHSQFSVGYTLILLNDVARTGGEIDRSINPGFIPGGTLVDPSERPRFRGDKSDFWVQGLSVGLVVTK